MQRRYNLPTVADEIRLISMIFIRLPGRSFMSRAGVAVARVTQ